MLLLETPERQWQNVAIVCTLVPRKESLLVSVVLITFLLVVSETGLNPHSGLPKVLCEWEIIAYSLQISKTIPVSAVLVL